VKWDHQVVATRRDKVIEVVQEYDPEEDEIADNVSTMQVSDNSKAPVNKMTKEKSSSTPLKSDNGNKPAAAEKNEKQQKDAKAKEKKNN